MAEKSTQLSIVIRTVDAATAKIKAINAQLDKVTKPVTDFKKALGDLREKSGLDDVIGGFKGVGSAITDVLGKIAMIGGIVGIAVGGLIHLVNEFDDLGKKAERLGVSVDFLAGMRDAAERTGAPVEALDEGLQAFTVNLGKAQAGTGRMASFLNKANPAFLQQLKSAKNNKEALLDLADAMEKEQNPARRAALAQATLGDAALAPLLHRGSKGIKELTDHYSKLAGSQEGAVKASTETHEAMLDLKDATDGMKASLVEGLAPALTVIIGQITEWLQGHREDIKEWAVSIGEKLPGAFNTLVEGIKGAIDFIEDLVDDVGGVKNVIIGLIAVMLGPLISAFITLGAAILTTPFGWFLAGVAAVVLAITELVKHWDEVKEIGEDVLEFMPGASSAKELSARREMKAADRDVKALDADPVLQAGRAAAHAAAHAAAMAAGPLGPQRDDFLYNVFGPGRTNLSGQASAAAGGTNGAANLNAPQQSKITVDFANAPKGMRATVDPQSDHDVDLNVGYQMVFP